MIFKVARHQRNWLDHPCQKEYRIWSWITSISYKGIEITNVPEPIYILGWIVKCHPRDNPNCTVDVYNNSLSIFWPYITWSVNLLFLSFNRKTIVYVSRFWVIATIVCQVYQIHDLIMLTVVLRWA